MIKLPTEGDNQSKISRSWSKCVFFWVRSKFWVLDLPSDDEALLATD
jgi:hypothetical protein